MNRLGKYSIGGFAAVVYLIGAFADRIAKLHALNALQYPDDPLLSFTMLFQPGAYPLFSIYAVAPICFAVAIFLLYQFSLSTRISPVKALNFDSLNILRNAGILFSLGATAMAFEPVLARWILGTPDLVNDHMAFLPFLVIGGSLASVSRYGKALWSRAEKMRSELDDIV